MPSLARVETDPVKVLPSTASTSATGNIFLRRATQAAVLCVEIVGSVPATTPPVPLESTTGKIVDLKVGTVRPVRVAASALLVVSASVMVPPGFTVASTL